MRIIRMIRRMMRKCIDSGLWVFLLFGFYVLVLFRSRGGVLKDRNSGNGTETGRNFGIYRRRSAPIADTNDKTGIEPNCEYHAQQCG